MFFAAILALAVGRFASMKSANNLDSLAGEHFSDRKQKEKKPKKVKAAKPSKATTVEDLIVEDVPEPKNKKVKEKSDRHFFGKKKVEAVQLLAQPSGYEEEYAPVASRNMDSAEIPEEISYEDLLGDNEVASFQASGPSLGAYVENSIASETPNSAESDYEDLDSWLEAEGSSDQNKDTEEDKKKRDDNSPFGPSVDWEF